MDRNREDEDEIEKQMGVWRRSSGETEARRDRDRDPVPEGRRAGLLKCPRTSSRDRTLQCTKEQDSRCSRAGNGETVDGNAGDRFPRQNQAADCGADR